MILWKETALLFVLASSSTALILFAEVGPQSPLMSEIIGTPGLGESVMLHKMAVAENASGLSGI